MNIERNNDMVKSISTAAAALALCMMLGGTAFADTGDAVGNTSQIENPEQLTEQDFLSWVGEGINTAADFIKNGWDVGEDSLREGMEAAEMALKEWEATVDDYRAEHDWSEEAKEAWETLKAGAGKQRQIAQEDLDRAYHTLRESLTQADKSIDQSVAAAVDSVASAAGVPDAMISSWYREVETTIRENEDTVSEAVLDAWSKIMQFSMDPTAVSEAELDTAFDTVTEWLSTEAVKDVETSAQTMRDLMKEAMNG